MVNNLQVKMLFPIAGVGLLAIVSVVLFVEQLSMMSGILLVLLLCIVQMAVSFWFFNHQIGNRLAKLKHYLALVISVDQAPSEPLIDHVGDDLADMTNELSSFIENLSDVLAEIRQESERLREGSGSLTSQISDAVIAVDQSSEHISQMASSIDNVASTSTTLSENAAQVSDTTSEVLATLQQGSDSSANSQKTMATFAQDVTGMAHDLEQLQEECSRIGSVLDVIRGIADQTNLLALNAAIEAARAGEQGRGFAVVADEVRALAHRTQESTVEIQSMVEGLQDKSNKAVDAINKGKQLTQDSLSQSEDVVEALSKVAQVFNEVNSLTTQIAADTHEQQHATASINENMVTVVSLSKEINSTLNHVAENAERQKATTEDVDTTLNRVCV
ncbi:methyl-accepting chemotaxis protein [Thalassotalea sediminis]|uniref:methyl-accepting chemotaxis protein n=1 Tax=Thalassotalea sediminis TaxID=1759089 RepID=UPI0025744250|nr:methyl-accepting chemotaxis protein [Thalassotalea sediminis]